MQWQNPSPSLDHDACGVGFVVRLGAPPSHEVIAKALLALERLSHRGAVDAEGTSGDGAGLMTAVPRPFFRRWASAHAVALPEEFAVGMVFLPVADEEQACRVLETTAAAAGLTFCGWRDVPTNPAVLGRGAAATLPRIRQMFLGLGKHPDAERQLFLYRGRAEALAPRGTYFCSLSPRTIVYKGLLSPQHLAQFYPDLADPEFRSTFAIFHQRFSTNTRPTWSLAQPFRFVGHNGEINTINGNRRKMRAREITLRKKFGVGDWFRALEEHVSDSATFDNALELRLRQDCSLAASMMRMTPPALQGDASVTKTVREWLAQQAWEQEPWDGPAALVFSDGIHVGAKLDRNGLRPMRYILSRDGLLLAGSEAGLLDLDERDVGERGRLGPGEILLADVNSGRLWRNSEVLRVLATSGTALPKTGWITPSRTHLPAGGPEDLKTTAAALGWTEDQFKILFQPLGADGKEAVWSMGDDAPPAYLSTLKRSVWDYCRQRFAQVTNPPIDPIREAHVMSLDVHLGRGVGLRSPVLDERQCGVIRKSFAPVCDLDITVPAVDGVEGALQGLRTLRQQAASAARHAGAIILSDRGVGPERAALPALLAVAAAANGIMDAGSRHLPLIVETGQAFEAHHVALMLAAGASAVHPYLAQALAERITAGGAARFRISVEMGLRKVLARMGISALASYSNSHLFEVIGLDAEVHREFFPDAAFVLPGRSLADVLGDALAQHAAALAESGGGLRDAGLYRFRKHGEQHATSPDIVRAIHGHVKSESESSWATYSEIGETRTAVAVRDLMEFAESHAVALTEEEVEAEAAIVTRFSTQAMSLGALSPEAHRTLTVAMNRLGGRSNTGEGGEDPAVYESDPDPNNDANNKVKQVASGRFGVTAEYLVNAEELEIKMAQGAKPGEGGQLPAAKVSPLIAKLRHVAPGTMLISPPPHHDIYSIEDLAQLIYDLRAVNPEARIGVKIVSGAGVGIVAVGAAKAGADVITISGHDGGTGASALTSIKNTGLPWEVGLREAHCELVRSGLRPRVRLRVDGGLKFGRDVVVAALLGADEFGFGTAALLAIGCVMARQCHLNTCPVGIATQDEKLRARFQGKPEMVISYFRGVAQDTRKHLAALGLRSLAEARGRVDLLRQREAQFSYSVGPLIDFSPPADAALRAATSQTVPTRPKTRSGETRLLSEGGLSRLSLRLTNADRSVGAALSGELLRGRQRDAAVPRLRCNFHGTAGQSFGAFLVAGVDFRLRGEANDYVGKGLSGGRIVVAAGAAASARGDVILGNTVLYGATGGELYAAGRAGERFAVRNSGALAVVEGAGHHACEYMTAGIVAVLGPTGINFGSGMTGGLAYVLRGELRRGVLNSQFVATRAMAPEEEFWLQQVLEQHVRFTGSIVAAQLLRNRLAEAVVRVQPAQVPVSIAETWRPVVAGLKMPVMSVPASHPLVPGVADRFGHPKVSQAPGPAVFGQGPTSI